MRGNFERAQKPLLKHEGGYSNDKNDPGGPTKYGITQKNLSIYLGHDATITEVKELTLTTALKIYKPRYWDAIKGDELPGGLDYCVFDGAVNSGPAQSTKWLQRALKKRKLYEGQIDGQLGATTLAGAKEAERAGLTGEIINDICDQRLAFMKKLRQWPSFAKGWTTRVAEVRRVSLAWDLEEEKTDISIPVVPPEVGSAKAPPSETKVSETPAGAEATKQITIGGGGLVAWGMSQFEKLGEYLSALSGMPPATARFLIGGVMALAFGALIIYGVLTLVRVFKRRAAGESLEAE